MRQRRQWAVRARAATSARRLILIGSMIGAGVALAVPLGASSATTPSLRSDQRAPQAVVRAQSNVALGDGRLRAAVERLGSGRSLPAGLEARGDKVLVEALLSGSAADARQTIAGFGGDVVGEVGNVLLEAYVPYGRLVALEHAAGIRSLRPPLVANVPVATNAAKAPLALLQGDEVAKTNAAAWHAAGFTGSGVKVGIVDYFDQAKWAAAQAAGEVPAPAGTFCRSHAADCTSTIFSAGSSHGEAVAEVIHEMAPDAQIYLASADSGADLQEAVNWFASQGVKIVSRSLTANYDNPGDGTGPLASIVSNAVSQGMTWFNSAGNAGGVDGVIPGSYWRGNWSDPDGDNVLNFAPNDEALGFVCGFVNGLRWSDWVVNKTDYDAYVYVDSGLTQLDMASIRDQSTPGVDPIEYPTCSHPGQVEYLVVQKFADNGSSPNGDVLEFMTNGTGLEYWQDPYSAAAPAVDVNSPGALSVGAIDPAAGTSIGPYSSQGPTNDNRIKPELSAASCVASFTLAPACFNGTSAAAPAAAGAAALVRSAGVATTAAQVKTWLLANATVDRGAAGIDNVFGAGELVLPAPPPPPATVPGAPTGVSAVPGDSSATVSWTAPASDGGSPITAYLVTPSVAGVAQPSKTVGNVATTVVGGLANGTKYTFQVRAVNTAGQGPDSAPSDAVTPAPSPLDWAANPSVDFDGDHITDLGALYRGLSPADSLWFATASGGGAPFQIFFGATSDIPVPGDYDGDGKTDAVIFRPSTGLWYGPRTGAAQIVIQQVVGQAGDIPIPGDYDGDRKTDPAYYRPSTGLFFAVLSGGGTKSSTFGAAGDVPVPRDYDGDGKTDFAIYRQNATPDHLGLWYAPLSGGGVYQIYFGAPGDIPVPGDYNGDRRAEAVIFRSQANALWYGPYNGAPGVFQLNLGTTGDTPIPGYYDNNLTVDPAVYRKSTGLWFALLSGGGSKRIDGLGLATDVPSQKRPALAGGL